MWEAAGERETWTLSLPAAVGTCLGAHTQAGFSGSRGANEIRARGC